MIRIFDRVTVIGTMIGYFVFYSCSNVTIFDNS